MRIDKGIRQRRSIRKYIREMPAEADIKKIIEAGTWAPSGLNNQPWKFKIIRGTEEKERLAGLTKYKKVISGSPVVICVFLDNAATYNREKDIMAVGACVQNILLQAYELGLGTCWLGEILNKRKEAESFLKTDPDHELMAVVAVGYPEKGITKGCRKRLNSFIIK